LKRQDRKKWQRRVEEVVAHFGTRKFYADARELEQFTLTKVHSLIPQR
jgi:hypothetical protein